MKVTTQFRDEYAGNLRRKLRCLWLGAIGCEMERLVVLGGWDDDDENNDNDTGRSMCADDGGYNMLRGWFNHIDIAGLSIICNSCSTAMHRTNISTV